MELKKARPEVKLVYKNGVGDPIVETFHYALWTDMTAEQSEFNEAFAYISSFALTKVNLFSLFDFSTIANNLLMTKKIQMAKDIAL
jgi:hypothetical protein